MRRLLEGVAIVVVVLGGAWLSLVLSWNATLKGHRYE
jgi:hypothetical protein